MPKPKYDPSAAFKSIVGIREDGKGGATTAEQAPAQKRVEESLPMVVLKKKGERKSKSVHVLVKPSTHENAQRKCEQIGVSLNECINQLLEYWVKE